MTLIDIGNTTACVYKNNHTQRIIIPDFNINNYKEKVFYISVNTKFKDFPSNFINLEPYFKLNTSYIGLGVDRIASCYYIKSGIIVDAGSAITVDKMEDGKHLGGFILPGIQAYLNAYYNISPRLKHELNTNINLQSLPNTTKDAISYGILTSVINSIKSYAKNDVIYLTGGDSKILEKYLNDVIIETNLIFKGMQKLINDLNL